jgi:hypothetical protein
MTAMASQRASGRLVSDQLWELLEPLIPPPPPAKNGRTGRPRVDNRAALEGILFVAEHGVNGQRDFPVGGRVISPSADS